jgi:hypothetical protein
VEEMSYESYCKAHNVSPFVSVKKACELENIGHTRFYELVERGEITLIPNGSRRNVTAVQLYERYRSRIAKAKSSQAA